MAQRSAEAAKSTYSLIEEANGNTQDGVSVSSSMESTLNKIASGVDKASSASEELAGQASELERLTLDLVQLTGGVVNSEAQQSFESSTPGGVGAISHEASHLKTDSAMGNWDKEPRQTNQIFSLDQNDDDFFATM